jgi:hypothetical protein
MACRARQHVIDWLDVLYGRRIKSDGMDANVPCIFLEKCHNYFETTNAQGNS